MDAAPQHIPLISWHFDLVPDLSFNASRDPFWSPEVYKAIVWDQSLSVEASGKARLTMEFAKMAYMTLELEVTILRWAIGIQQFLMEEFPSHLCWMIYTDSRIATLGVNIETNTKQCKLRPSFLDQFELHFGVDMDAQNE